jgi:hypothetical protein
MFQTSTTNADTGISAIPNGTAVTGVFQAHGASDPTNASYGSFACVGGTDVRISSAIRVTGTYLPMTFYTANSERIRIFTSGGISLVTLAILAQLIFQSRALFQPH